MTQQRVDLEADEGLALGSKQFMQGFDNNCWLFLRVDSCACVWCLRQQIVGQPRGVRGSYLSRSDRMPSRVKQPVLLLRLVGSILVLSIAIWAGPKSRSRASLQ
jgi:hypothetical protein